MENINIVIADDIESNNIFLAQALKKDNRINIVGIAENGIKEYELIKRYNPDLVITDNKMPNMTGIEVIRKIASENLSQKPAFIIVSGDTFKNLEKELNVIGIFGKPVNYDLILRKISDYIEESNDEKIDVLEIDNNGTNNGLLSCLFNKFIRKYF